MNQYLSLGAVFVTCTLSQNLLEFRRYEPVLLGMKQMQRDMFDTETRQI